MIAIKDMEELPKNCAECNMTTCKGKDEPWNYVCSINMKDIDFNETDRAEHCPLVEIVTCKDCKHCCHITDTPKALLCEKHNCQQVSKNFYCADGERRE